MDISATLDIDSSPPQPLIRFANRQDFASTRDRGRIRHIRDWELTYMVSGTMWYWWEHTNTFHLQQPGEAMLIPPGLVHAYARTKPGEQIFVHFDLHARPELKHPGQLASTDNWRELGQTREPPWFQLGTGPGSLVLPAVQPVNRTRWQQALGRILEQFPFRMRDLRSQMWTSACILELLTDLDRSHEVRSEQADSRIISCIAELPSTADPSIAVLAEQCGMSESSFRSAFKRTTGELPHRFFERRRIDAARQLLRETDLSIAEIAAACGYDDPFHFSRVCKRVSGSPPSVWRQPS